MSNYGLKFSKDGVNVFTAEPKDLLISTEFDTFKIFRTGELTIHAPQEIMPDPYTTIFHEASFNHNLGYKPFVLPYVWVDVLNPVPANITLDGGVLVHTPTSSAYDVNNIAEQRIFPGVWGLPFIQYAYELFRLDVTDTKITLRMGRFGNNDDPFTGPKDVRFEPSTATLHYTIYYNQVDDVLSLM